MNLRLTLAMAGFGLLGIVFACSSSDSGSTGACKTLGDCCVSSGQLSSCLLIVNEGN